MNINRNANQLRVCVGDRQFGLKEEDQMALSMSFDTVIRPYFTPCYRAHMVPANLDLWDYDTVKQAWQAIHDSVKNKKMPVAGCAEGVWDDRTRDQFIADFVAWKAAGFPK